MKLVGLTGGIGMGKTAAEKWLRLQDIPALDTDVLAREIVEPGQPALQEIQRVFGDKLIGPDGRLRREALARIVFSDPAGRQQLERITHPRIRGRWMQQVQWWQSEDQPLAVIVIPLLFETGARKDFDSTICVACTAATQRQRLLDRGWSETDIELRNTAQWPIEKKIALSDFVIWTEGSLEVLGDQLGRVFAGVLPVGP